MKTVFVALAVATCLFSGASDPALAGCYNCAGYPGNMSCVQAYWSGHVVCVAGYDNCWLYGPCQMAGCFPEGALVTTPSGLTPIELLEVGDFVVSLDEDGNQSKAVVTDTHRSVSLRYYIINDGIRVTGQHPFLIGDNWVNAEDLRVGDELVNGNGGAILIHSIEVIDFGVRVYNISVSGTHTFFVDGALVHNKEPTPEG